jgi:cbb3-type cytochrome oxidase subunit 3
MFDWLTWFTHMENTKPLALVLFFAAFCGILIYVFTGRQRARRLESYKYIPFQDEAADPADLREASKHERTQH